jgi:hypothetical protein
MSNYGLNGFPKNNNLGAVQVGSTNLNASLSSNAYAPGFMGVFGSGAYAIYVNKFTGSGYTNTYTFTVPVFVTKIRVRVIGAGGGGAAIGTGGGGGGYAHGVFTVSPGSTYSVTAGISGPTGGTSTGVFVAGSDGGTSSFGSLISATGGGGGTSAASYATVGVGIGGDFQSKGGSAGLTPASGGGGSGSQLGDGGTTPAWSAGGGGAPVMGDSFGNFGSGPQVPQQLGLSVFGNISVSYPNLIVRFPFDGFTGGNCMYTSYGNPGNIIASLYGQNSGVGGMGRISTGTPITFEGTSGGTGGGGGGSFDNTGSPAIALAGGIGGGGGGSYCVGTVAQGGLGGRGLVVVEW